MNEAETRAELIDPKLKENGWDVKKNPEVKVFREFPITPGKIQAGEKRKNPLKADYVLAYKGRKLAVVEAKSDEEEVGEGVGQAKNYAGKLKVDDTYAANGREIYYINMESGYEGLVNDFQTPDELWNKTFPKENKWQNDFNLVPFEELGGTKPVRFFQETAIERALDAIANKKLRVLLTLATGTGKTYIAFQIAWRLYHTRWNLTSNQNLNIKNKKEELNTELSSENNYINRRPRILFLADRNILADQAFNAFTAFPEDALVRIKPKDIRKKGCVPTNGSIFFTIFQTFMSGPNNTPYFGEYPNDFFDFIIIDECHRGGANDESNWREIMEYFSPAVQIGLTATPKRKENADTYKYFGEPVYIYSLKDGINDGFLTPFKIKRIKTSLDEYIYETDDKVVEGEIEEGKVYKESDFNRIIEIKAREQKRVKIFMDLINQNEKTIVFCASQEHAAAVRDLINQYKASTGSATAKDPLYCVRVTANDGELGEQFLREFQDNEKSIPTILTTSQKLSTGVDARNIRNIVLMRAINSMIEFKQIIGRGTRLFEGKEFFTIYDFVNACHHFADPEWDGEPEEPEPKDYIPPEEPEEFEDSIIDYEEPVKRKMIKVKLRDGKEYEIEHSVSSTFFSADGTPISAQEFLNQLFGKLPEFFKSEEELRRIWSSPLTRKVLLDKFESAGYGKEELGQLQKLVDAEKSDLFDVLEYITYSVKPITREERVAEAQNKIFALLDRNQKEFLEFVLSKYIETGEEELEEAKLPDLLELKYQAVSDGAELLGGVGKIRSLFIDFQKELYGARTA